MQTVLNTSHVQKDVHDAIKGHIGLNTVVCVLNAFGVRPICSNVTDKEHILMCLVCVLDLMMPFNVFI